jgi:DNA polymerase-1
MLLGCNRCKLTCSKPMLRGSGEHAPDVLIVGDVPDKEGFAQQVPFAGKTGQFLRKLVDRLLDDNQTVFYTHAIRCLPPDHHNVTPTEIEACSMWLRGEIERIQPKRILLLGATATRSLFGKTAKMTKLRGKRLFYKNIPTVSTFHPKYVMGFDHNEQAGPAIRKQWQDDMILAFSDVMEVVETPEIEVVGNQDFCRRVRKWGTECFVTFDIETSGFDPWKADAEVRCISASNGTETIVTEVLQSKNELKTICLALSRCQLIAQNAKFDCRYLLVHTGVNLFQSVVGDTMLMAYAIDERQKLSLKNLTTKYFPQYSGYDDEMLKLGAWGEVGFKGIPIDILMKYNAMDSFVTWKLHELFKSMMDRTQLDYVSSVLLDGTEMLLDVEMNGMKIDLKRVDKITRKVTSDIQKISEEIKRTEPYRKFQKKFDKDPNLKSPRDKAQLVYTLSGIRCTKFTASKKNPQPSTEKDELAKLNTPIAKAMVEMSERQKILTTYAGDAAYSWVKSDGLIHSSFGFTKLEFGKEEGISTGRLSSADPNLQNAPNPKKGSPYNVRGYFVSRFPDGEILSADYKAFELRIFALITGAKFFVRCFKENRDPHSEMASKIFSVDIRDVSPEQRETGKTCNFELLYESSAYGLMHTHGGTQAYWERMIREWTKVVPEVLEYRSNIKHDIVNKGYVESLIGARRHFDWSPNLSPKEKGSILREAGNHPIQNTASGLNVNSAIRLNKQFKRDGVTSLIVNLVHDNILIDYDPTEENIPEIVRDTMEHPPFSWLKIPTPVDITITPSWGGD